MTRNTLVTGLFKTPEQAAAAITDLIQSGVRREDLSVLAAEGTSVEAFGIKEKSKAGEGAAIGGATGVAAGALIGGFTAVGAIATGGIGILAAGPIIAALAGAGLGGAAGGVLGGLIGLGIPEHQVKFYRNALEAGSVLVGAQVSDEQKTLVQDIFRRHGAESPTTEGISPRKNDAPVSRMSGAVRSAGGVNIAEHGLGRLLVNQLRDIYYVEKQLVSSLPDMVNKANNQELSSAFASHLSETRNHVSRLEEIFDRLGLDAKAEKCPAFDGLLKEAKDLMKLDETPGLQDAALICAAQKIEHYEIATYGCVRAYAHTLGLTEIARLLDEILEEEVGADSKLTDIAEARVNEAAAGATMA